MINNELAIIPYDYVCPKYPFAVHVEPNTDIAADQGSANMNLTAFIHQSNDEQQLPIDDSVALYFDIPSDEYLRVYVSDYIVNSFLYTYQQQGYVFTVNQELVDQLKI